MVGLWKRRPELLGWSPEVLVWSQQAALKRGEATDTVSVGSSRLLVRCTTHRSRCSTPASLKHGMSFRRRLFTSAVSQEPLMTPGSWTDTSVSGAAAGCCCCFFALRCGACTRRRLGRFCWFRAFLNCTRCSVLMVLGRLVSTCTSPVLLPSRLSAQTKVAAEEEEDMAGRSVIRRYKSGCVRGVSIHVEE